MDSNYMIFIFKGHVKDSYYSIYYFYLIQIYNLFNYLYYYGYNHLYFQVVLKKNDFSRIKIPLVNIYITNDDYYYYC